MNKKNELVDLPAALGDVGQFTRPKILQSKTVHPPAVRLRRIKTNRPLPAKLCPDQPAFQKNNYRKEKPCPKITKPKK